MTEREILVGYAEARKAKAKLSLELKEVQAVIDEKESQLVNLLLDKEATSTAKYDGLGFVTLQDPKLYASYQKEDEPTVFAFVRERGEGAIIKEAIHYSSMSKFVEGLIKDGKEVPKILSYYLKQGLKFFDRSERKGD